MGEPMDDRVGFVYAYCLKHLCGAHGEFLDDSAWYPAGYPHLERVQEALDVARRSARDHRDFGAAADTEWGDGYDVFRPPAEENSGKVIRRYRASQ